jgi:hypothetical protein
MLDKLMTYVFIGIGIASVVQACYVLSELQKVMGG